MAKKRALSQQDAEAAVRFFLGLPVKARIALIVLALVAGVVALGVWMSNQQHPHGADVQPADAGAMVPPGTVVFAFWNVENLFDDQDDRRNSIDNPYDDWFATDEAARKLKYDHLADIILQVNHGKGPDVLACVEVESARAAELLKDTLNARLPPEVARYQYVVMKELPANAGRFMAPCVISRLPLDTARTTLHGRSLRILETHVVANGHDLCLVASHWTSQLRQPDGSHGEKGRMNYATTIYQVFDKLASANPDADFLVCGDFNDTADSQAVTKGLHVTGTRSDVVPTRTAPRLLGLLSDKPADRFGTHYYSRPLIYDHVAVSPGMLDDKGWECDPDSVRVPTEGMMRDRTHRRPWRFGDRDDNPLGRGYSDHFPVVVNLRLAPPAP